MKKLKIFVLVLCCTFFICAGMAGCGSTTTKENPSSRLRQITITKSNASAYVDDIRIYSFSNVRNTVTVKAQMRLKSNVKSISNLKITFSATVWADFILSNGYPDRTNWSYIMFMFSFKNSSTATYTKSLYYNSRQVISTVTDADFGNGFISNASGTIYI